MKRLYIPIFLSLLSLSAVINLGVAWWPSNWHMPTSAKQLSTPSAHAEEQSPPTSPGVENSPMLEPSLVGTAEASIFPGNPANTCSQEEVDVLRKLRTIKEGLDTRARTLDQRQQSIEEAETGIAKRVSELEGLLAKIHDSVQQEESIRSKKIKRLTGVYASMKAEKAAPVISKMELLTVVQMFTRMDEKKVGKILSFLPPDQAVKITQALTKKISSLKN